jgi:hypothetical protein
MTQVTTLQQQKQLVVKRNGKNFKVEIAPEILSQMVIYNSKHKVSVLELSQTCNVLLIPLRYMQCCLCSYAIMRMAELYKVLLQCNTIPVLIHQESEEEATEYIEQYPTFKKHPNRDVLCNLFRVADPTGSYFYDQLKVEEYSSRLIYDVAKSIPKIRHVMTTMKMERPKKIVKHWTRYPSFFIIEKGLCVNAFYSKSFGGTIDYTRALVDPEQKSCIGDVCAQTMSLEQLNEMFGVYINLANFKGKDSDILSRLTGSSFCISESIAHDDLLPSDVDTIDLISVLQDPDMRRYFKLYSMKELSVENILFYEAVLKFRSNDNVDTIQQEAKDIFNRFLVPSSHLEINIGSHMRKKITSIIQQEEESDLHNNRTMFDEICTYIESANLADTFHRFKRHDSFLEMIETRK